MKEKGSILGFTPTSFINDKSEGIDLLGFLKYTTKLTGLDCTACAAAKNGNGSKICGFLARLFSIVVILSMLYRAITFLGEEGKLLTFNWSESNSFGFMGLHAFVCSLCVMGWTANARFPNHIKRLNEVRVLRVEPNEEIDDYSGFRKKAFFFSLPWLATLVSTALFNALQEKILFSGAVVPAYKYSLFPALAFIVWMTTSTCLAFYALFQFSMVRETEYFNKELQKASEDKKLKDPTVIADFSYRQRELLKLVNETNEFLQSYAKVAPLFCFFSIINAIFNLSFFSFVPVPYAIMLVFLLACIIGMIILSLLPAAKVQDQIVATSKILMESEDFENAENQKVYQTYRLMVDRSLKSETRIFVVNAFGINSNNLNIAMFVIPNLGPLLMMLEKLIDSNGYSSSH
ncbi:Serpentine Receptor, class R [Caenorhabditis elegans]|uniref:Serpentine Receptor, class R n=1 Tax=Caenorhabditis elegans TaxID=6239 RepID=H2KYR4_CAEEL|nr:Serpentine Receptor, class R [Caenorhabditis elegans]CCD64408.1 Serpentine Receptor, class R [Caenorhabditis elegans]|eukprot:NP_001122976.1 Serpentine Receptor, class R [Caenorhabditis elegans]